MNNPWTHDDATAAVGDGGTGSRGALRLAAVLWLLVGATAFGLYVGLHTAPRSATSVPTAPSLRGPPVEVHGGDGGLLVLFRGGGTAAGLRVNVARPGLTVILGGDEIVVA